MVKEKLKQIWPEWEIEDPPLGKGSYGVVYKAVRRDHDVESFAAIKAKVGAMPDKATWPMFFAVACLGGIGFTMSIFVDTLSFGNCTPEVMNQLRDAGKIAILLASITAGVLGSVLISIVSGLKKKNS